MGPSLPSKSLIIHATLSLSITVRSLRNEGGAAWVFFCNALRQRKKNLMQDGEDLGGRCERQPHIGWFARLLSALEWRTGPEMNMDEMNERSNAKASPRVFALVRTKHAAFSHVQQKASRMFYSECNVYIGSHFGQAVAWTAVQGKWSFHHSTKIRCLLCLSASAVQPNN